MPRMARGDQEDWIDGPERMFLQTLGDRLRKLDEDHAILVEAAGAVGARLGADRATFAECNAEGTRFVIASEWPVRIVLETGGPVLNSQLGLDLIPVLQTGDIICIEDVRDDSRLEDFHRQLLGNAGVVSTIAAPILRDGRPAAMLALQCRKPRRWTDDEARLVDQVAERSWAALERARALAALRSTQQRQSFLLALGDALNDESDPDAILAVTNRMLGEHLGALRVGYGEIDESDTYLILKADWTNGVPSNAGTFLLESYGNQGADENRAGRTFVSADLAADPRVGPAHMPAFDRFGVKALIAVPLIRAGRFTAVLSVQSGTARHWSDEEVRLCQEVAARTWAILERARAEADLRDREEQLRNAIDAAQLGTFEWNLQTGLGRWSDRAVEMLDAPTNTPTLQDWAAMMHPEDASMVVDSLQQASARHGRMTSAYRIKHRTGETHWIASHGRVIHDAEGRPVGTRGVLVDVTERHVAQQRLAESEARLAAFLHHAPASMYLKDAEGRYLLANEEVARRLETDPATIVGKTLFDIAPPEVAEHASREEREVLDSGEPKTTEQSFVLQGEMVHALATRFPVPDAQGRPAYIGGVLIDITSQKRAEDELARSREALYQSEKLTALGSLLAGVSHELNNPLAVVAGQAMLLEEDAAGTPHAVRAAKIKRAAERCAKIVQTFLAMARQKQPERRLVYANEVVRAALDLTDYGLRTAGVRVTCRLAAGLPPLHADPDQLHQVLANLLINAQHALLDVTGERRLTVATRALSGRIEIEISDNGPGIPLDVRRRVFEPFFTTKAQGVGTGLGLSFSLGVVEAHGGKLELLDIGQGAAFRISLPAAQPTAPEQVPPPVKRALSARGRLLVVDDEPDVGDLIAEMLESQGWTVRVATGGAAAKSLLRAERFDFILSDLRMPDFDGPALHAWLAEYQPDMARRIAFVTGDTLGPAARRFLTDTGVPCIEKPFTPQMLRSLLDALNTPAH